MPQLMLACTSWSRWRGSSEQIIPILDRFYNTHDPHAPSRSDFVAKISDCKGRCSPNSASVVKTKNRHPTKRPKHRSPGTRHRYPVRFRYGLIQLRSSWTPSIIVIGAGVINNNYRLRERAHTPFNHQHLKPKQLRGTAPATACN